MAFKSTTKPDAMTRQHYVIVEDGEPSVILETPAKVESVSNALDFAASHGTQVSPTHKEMLRLLRAKFLERGVTLDAMIDTMESARTSATNRYGFPDHKVRLDAVKLEATMLGIIGTSALAAVEETKAEQHAAFTRSDLAGKDRKEIVSEVLRRIEVAKSKGALRDEDVVLKPEQVDKLASFSRAAVGEEVASVVSLKTRRGTKINPHKTGVQVELDMNNHEKASEAFLEAIDGE